MTSNVSIYERVGHIELDVDGIIKRYDGLDFRFSIEKVAGGGTPNFAHIGILGLSRTTVNDIATYLQRSFYGSRRKLIKIYAGYRKTGEQLIFCGDIIIAKPSQPPDNWISISAQTNGWMRSEVTSFDLYDEAQKDKVETGRDDKKITIRFLFERIAKLYGMSLEYKTDNPDLDREIVGFDCTGSYQDIFRRANTLSSVKMMCEYTAEKKQIIIVYDDSSTNANGSKIYNLSAESGLIGIPEFMFPEVKFRMLMNPYIHLFDDVNIKSILVPNAGGIFNIRRIRYNGHFRGTPWYMDCEARLSDYENIAKRSSAK